MGSNDGLSALGRLRYGPSRAAWGSEPRCVAVRAAPGVEPSQPYRPAAACCSAGPSSGREHFHPGALPCSDSAHNKHQPVWTGRYLRSTRGLLLAATAPLSTGLHGRLPEEPIRVTHTHSRPMVVVRPRRNNRRLHATKGCYGRRDGTGTVLRRMFIVQLRHFQTTRAEEIK